MDNPPSPSLVADIEAFLLKTFDISTRQARGLAPALFDLVQERDRPQTLMSWEWQYRAKEELADKLRWRSEAEKERFRLEQALAKNMAPPRVGDFLAWRDRPGFRGALKELASTGRATTAEIRILKLVADPASTHFGPGDQWENRILKSETLITLAAVGAGRDPDVLNWLSTVISRRITERKVIYYCEQPLDLLILVALDEPAAIPALRSFADRAIGWALRVACLYRLPESRQNGIYDLIESFREWLEHADFSGEPNYSHLYYFRESWRTFISCLTLRGLVRLLGRERHWPADPPVAFSPLIDWAMQRGRSDWLMGELKWMQAVGAWFGASELRNALVERGVPGAAEFCLEQVKNRQPNEDAQWDVVHNALTRHPKPLPKAALDACVEVLLHPCHPSRYEHRIDAVNLLVEAAAQGHYPKEQVQQLVLQLAQTEPDPDVRIAAIRWATWASPQEARAVLAGALGRDSARIREAAQRALGQG